MADCWNPQKHAPLAIWQMCGTDIQRPSPHGACWLANHPPLQHGWACPPAHALCINPIDSRPCKEQDATGSSQSLWPRAAQRSLFVLFDCVLAGLALGRIHSCAPAPAAGAEQNRRLRCANGSCQANAPIGRYAPLTLACIAWACLALKGFGPCCQHGAKAPLCCCAGKSIRPCRLPSRH